MIMIVTLGIHAYYQGLQTPQPTLNPIPHQQLSSTPPIPTSIAPLIPSPIPILTLAPALTPPILHPHRHPLPLPLPLHRRRRGARRPRRSQSSPLLQRQSLHIPIRLWLGPLPDRHRHGDADRHGDEALALDDDLLAVVVVAVARVGARAGARGLAALGLAGLAGAGAAGFLGGRQGWVAVEEEEVGRRPAAVAVAR
ncbi:hypothetical protein VTI74DRAFT_939 [Chaetomium olivicolor]